MAGKTCSTFVLACVVLLAATQFPRADWVPGGTIVCKAPLAQWFPMMVEDGKGGVVIAWWDQRWTMPERGPQYHDRSSVFAQRLDAFGNPVWTSEGVLISKVPPRDWLLEIAPDAEGGAFIAWSNPCPNDPDTDFCNYEPILYVQRVDASGTLVFPGGGLVVTAELRDERCRMIQDGEGGAIVAWASSKYQSGDQSIAVARAQRIARDGSMLWGPEGVVVRSAGDFGVPDIVTDGAGGAIFAGSFGPTDFPPTPPANTYKDIYAQKVDASGAIQWGENGVTICSAPSGQTSPVAASDGAGGAIIAWMDSRNRYLGDLYAQRVDKEGTPLWAPDGIPLCPPTAQVGRQEPTIVSDGSGGAIVAWTECRYPCWQIYAQRVDGSGNHLWKDEGLPVCATQGTQMRCRLTRDLAGGAAIVWYDYRSLDDPIHGSGPPEIYAQRLDANGNAMWGNGGVLMGNLLGAWSIWWPQIVPDGSGGAIVGWHNVASREAYNMAIRALRLDRDGRIPQDTTAQEPPDTTGNRSTDIASPLQVFPNPFNPRTRVSYYVDKPGTVALTVFDSSGRLTRTLFSGFQMSGTHEVVWDGKNNAGKDAASGVYFCRIVTGTQHTSKRMVLIR